MEQPTAPTGEEIRRAREARRMTQKQLAELIGVGERSIGRWERDETIPRSAIGALRQVLDLDSRAVTEIDHGPPLRKASSAELLAELARRMEATQEPSSVTDLPTGRYRMRKSSGPAAAGQQADDQDEGGRNQSQ